MTTVHCSNQCKMVKENIIETKTALKACQKPTKNRSILMFKPIQHPVFEPEMSVALLSGLTENLNTIKQ